MKAKLLIATLAVTSTVAAADSSDLIRLYEEEILAHDLYVELGKKYPGIRPLQNIPHSEDRHRQVMAGILQAEGLALPEPSEGRRFVTEGLDTLYRNWLRQGRKSEVAACEAGVRLEDHDIADLRRAQRDFPEHKQALAQLEAASKNHLRAFHRNLTGRGGDYKAEALPTTDFTAIVEGGIRSGACGGACELRHRKGSLGDPGKKAGGDCGSCDSPRPGRDQGSANGRGRQRRQGRDPGGRNR